jgi:DNA-binding LacI/PurR family transcriptional regulator
VRVTRVSGAPGIEEPVDGGRPSFVISADTYRAVKLAVEHLADLGHQRIGHIDAGYAVGGGALCGRVLPNLSSYLGFLSGLRERNLSTTCVLGVPHSLFTSPSVDWAAEHKRFFKHCLDRLDTWPTAFVCMADFRAGPLLRLLRERGLRVPEDISVVGIGNTPWALALDPPLTSVCLGEAEMARMALLLNDEPEPERTRVYRVDPELVVRQSAGKPARSSGSES